jgi:DHA2 family multidrug resistance protein-like MFS transporter
VIAIVGFALFGIGLGLYATPSTDPALSNVLQQSAESASGIYKMASSLGAALGVAISAAIVAGLSQGKGFGLFAEIAMGRTENIGVRFAASMALLFNVSMVGVGIIAIMATVPKRAHS